MPDGAGWVEPAGGDPDETARHFRTHPGDGAQFLGPAGHGVFAGGHCAGGVRVQVQERLTGHRSLIHTKPQRTQRPIQYMVGFSHT